MKTAIKVLATMLMLVASQAAFSIDPPAKNNVQVLPAGENILKVLYVNPSNRYVNVRLFDENGLVFQDRIKVVKGENGFVKRYELTDIESHVLWVEISDKDVSYKYKVLQNDNGKMWATYWDQYPETMPMMAAK